MVSIQKDHRPRIDFIPDANSYDSINIHITYTYMFRKIVLICVIGDIWAIRRTRDLFYALANSTCGYFRGFIGLACPSEQ